MACFVTCYLSGNTADPLGTCIFTVIALDWQWIWAASSGSHRPHKLFSVWSKFEVTHCCHHPRPTVECTGRKSVLHDFEQSHHFPCSFPVSRFRSTAPWMNQQSLTGVDKRHILHSFLWRDILVISLLYPKLYRYDNPSKVVSPPPRCDANLGETSIHQIQIQIQTQTERSARRLNARQYRARRGWTVKPLSSFQNRQSSRIRYVDCHDRSQVCILTCCGQRQCLQIACYHLAKWCLWHTNYGIAHARVCVWRLI